MFKKNNEEKHKNENFDCLKQENKKEFLNKVFVKENMNKVIKQIHKLYVNKERSKNMMGKNNHNFGKPKLEETKKKMSISISISKNGVSDDVILIVRKLISEGKKNIDIQKQLNLPRHTVTRIKNGTLSLNTEDKKEKVVLSIDQRNIDKRKVKLDEIFFILDKLFEKKLSQVQILKEVNSIRNNDTTEQLTIHIIKNINRNILNLKKIPFYEFENPKRYKYEKHQKISKNKIRYNLNFKI
jgi:hypothetical protein